MCVCVSLGGGGGGGSHSLYMVSLLSSAQLSLISRKYWLHHAETYLETAQKGEQFLSYVYISKDKRYVLRKAVVIVDSLINMPNKSSFAERAPFSKTCHFSWW